jgi:predicted DNA-binding transcriptional regulator AlpA
MPKKHSPSVVPDEPEVVVPFRPAPRLLDKAEVLRRVPLSFPTIWNLMRQEPPQFPRSRTIGRKTAWLESDVTKWVNSRPENTFKKVEA